MTKLAHSIFVIVGISLIIGSASASISPPEVGDEVPSTANSIGEILSFDASNYTQEYTTNVKVPPVVIGDAKISEVWDSVPAYPISSYGAKGLLSSIHVGGYVYFKIEVDLTLEWFAVQWDSDNSSDPENFADGDMEPMAPNDDMWVFGKTPETSVFGDAYSLGSAPPFLGTDVQNDLFWEALILNDTSGAPVAKVYEVGRAFDTGDVEGHDVRFSDAFNVSVYFASSEKHRPDSSVTHAKFVIADLGLGGNFTVATEGGEETVEVKNLVIPYLFYNIGAALFGTSLLYALVVYLSVKQISKEV